MKILAAQVLMLPLLAWLVWSADIWTAISLMYPAYILVVVTTCGLLLLPRAFVRRPAVVVVPSIWLAFLLALPFVTNSSLKPLLWGVRDLEQGMNREAVLQTLKGRYAGTTFAEPLVSGEESGDRWGQPRATRLCIKPQGRSPSLQAESLLVFFEDSGFTHAVFSAD